VGLPQIDFRVPEATWFKSAVAGKFGGLAGRFSTMPGLSSTGALAWPYKVAVVTVMAIVACGTLVTFGSAEAETPTQSAEPAALPGSDEVGPTVEGQVIPPPSAALLNSADLLSTLNLTDYTPYDIGDLASNDDDDDNDDDEDTKDDIKKKLAANATPTPTPTGTKKPTTAPTSKPTTPAPTPTKTTPAPTPTKTTAPPPKPTCKKVWVQETPITGHWEEKCS
jgi:hypothetical protein